MEPNFRDFIARLKMHLDKGRSGGRAVRMVVEEFDAMFHAEAKRQRVSARNALRRAREESDDEIPF
jgi:hypothetical protein